MITYEEIVNNTRTKLNRNINWWPVYLYHFTDVHNAVNIIDKEYIFGRKLANESESMKIDNASSRIIDITSEEAARYARLYMRPRTPTQYHNEGYKPEHIRDSQLNANCPVPIFFLLDTIRTLQIKDVKFIEKGLAGGLFDESKLLSGAENFNKLNFEKIFHEGWYSQSESDIKEYRHTEVVRENGIPIHNIIRAIVCRSIAEKQTLLYLLKKTSIKMYRKYKNIIRYKPETDLFYNNGIYIKEVRFENDKFIILLNDNDCRYNKSKSSGEDVKIRINIDWLSDKSQVIGRVTGSLYVDYKSIEKINFNLATGKKSDQALVEVYMDENLMFINEINLSEVQLV